jgi:hypothetical protein
LGTSSLNVASTGLPSGPMDAATTMPLDSIPRRFLGYPMLHGTIRDHVKSKRRAFIRLFACKHG